MKNKAKVIGALLTITIVAEDKRKASEEKKKKSQEEKLTNGREEKVKHG